MNKIFETDNNKKHLLVFDLDGTILSNYTHLDPNIAYILKELEKRGHIVCIASGRNLLSIYPIYKEIGLNTAFISYNGGYITHPSISYSGVSEKNQYISSFCISNEVTRKLIGEHVVKENLINLMIDPFPGMISISTSDDIYYSEVFFNGNKHIKKENFEAVLEHLETDDCLQIVLEFNNDNELLSKIISLLKSYRNSISFYYGTKLKENLSSSNEKVKILIPDDSKIIMKLRSVNASKGKAVEIISGYYNIPLSSVITFGNDENDIEMTEVVVKNGGNGIVVSNSNSGYLKSISSEIIGNHEGTKDAISNYLVKKFGIIIKK